jgi:hypothetical protein
MSKTRRSKPSPQNGMSLLRTNYSYSKLGVHAGKKQTLKHRRLTGGGAQEERENEYFEALTKIIEKVKPTEKTSYLEQLKKIQTSSAQDKKDRNDAETNRSKSINDLNDTEAAYYTNINKQIQNNETDITAKNNEIASKIESNKKDKEIAKTKMEEEKQKAKETAKNDIASLTEGDVTGAQKIIETKKQKDNTAQKEYDNTVKKLESELDNLNIKLTELKNKKIKLNQEIDATKNTKIKNANDTYSNAISKITGDKPNRLPVLFYLYNYLIKHIKEKSPTNDKKKEIENKELLKFVVQKIRDIERHIAHPDLLDTFLYYFELFDFSIASQLMGDYLSGLYVQPNFETSSDQDIVTVLEKGLINHANNSDFEAETIPDKQIYNMYTIAPKTQNSIRNAIHQLNALFSSKGSQYNYKVGEFKSSIRHKNGTLIYNTS